MTDPNEFDDARPTGMTVREAERLAEARQRGEGGPDARDPSGRGTVSERIERESVVGGHGHGGELDREIEREAKANG